MSRVLRTVKGWLQAFVEPAADPRQSFAYTYKHQRELLDQIRQAIADLATARAQVDTKIKSAQDRLPRLESEARAALVAGDEDLARFKVQRRQIALLEAKSLEQQASDLQQEQSRLSALEHQLTLEIEALFARQELVAARQSAAQAQASISDTIGGVSEEMADLHRALTEAEERAELIRTRASDFEHGIIETLTESPRTTSSTALERKIVELHLDQAVEEELTALKRKVHDGESETTV